ncbi:hypothetical protein EJ02DRAFT_106047 [Clathrospora elynae]|uniref:Uncharacterized protein n=1 Tax=Clathrospora elynae TaxID=706981 RepID=A0A6A5S5R6_9PLEO|nr:hypothetical protein EJ02DRAFT_106047 [Clathrospora elynae]
MLMMLRLFLGLYTHCFSEYIYCWDCIFGSVGLKDICSLTEGFLYARALLVFASMCVFLPCSISLLSVSVFKVLSRMRDCALQLRLFVHLFPSAIGPQCCMLYRAVFSTTCVPGNLYARCCSFLDTERANTLPHLPLPYVISPLVLALSIPPPPTITFLIIRASVCVCSSSN